MDVKEQVRLVCEAKELRMYVKREDIFVDVTASRLTLIRCIVDYPDRYKFQPLKDGLLQVSTKE